MVRFSRQTKDGAVRAEYDGNKVAATHSALAGQWIDVLITERFTAKRLLGGA